MIKDGDFAVFDHGDPSDDAGIRHSTHEPIVDSRSC
jgi:hypothetical protein